MKTLAIFTSIILLTLPAFGHHSPFEEEAPWLWYIAVGLLCVTVITAYTYSVGAKRRKLNDQQGHRE